MTDHITDAEVLELARIAWDRENAANDVPAGLGYDWDDLGSNMRDAAAAGIRAVLVELERQGHLIAQRPPLGYVAVDTRSEVVLTKGYWTTLAEATAGWGSSTHATVVEMREAADRG